MVIMFVPKADANAIVIDSFSDMPENSVLLNPGGVSDPFGLIYNTLPSYGIHASNPIYSSLGSFINDVSSNIGSTVAPHNRTIYRFPVQFVFDEPIYAMGSTFFATNYPAVDNLADPFDNNFPNKSFTVTAYDINGNLIETSQSSEYGDVLGPVEYGYSSRGTQFMASFSGFWTDTPIHRVTFLGLDDPVWQDAAWSSIAFSNTPLEPSTTTTPEPSTVLLLGSALIGLVFRRKKPL